MMMYYRRINMMMMIYLAYLVVVLPYPYAADLAGRQPRKFY